MANMTFSVSYFLSPFPHVLLTSLKCCQYDWRYWTCLGLSFMLCTYFLWTHLVFSVLISLLLVKSFCQRAWGRKSLHMNLPWRSMWQGGGFISSMWNWKCKWHPEVGWGAAASSGPAVPPLACFLLLCLRSIPRYLYIHTVKKNTSLQNENGIWAWGISVLETLSGVGREEGNGNPIR